MFGKMISAVKGKITAVSTAVIGIFAASSASASMDAAAVSAITDAVDFGTIVTGIGAIGASLGVVYVAWKGVKLLLGALRSA